MAGFTCFSNPTNGLKRSAPGSKEEPKEKMSSKRRQHIEFEVGSRMTPGSSLVSSLQVYFALP